MKCHSCLIEFSSSNDFYCKRCTDVLFGGVSVMPLDFDKEKFYQFRQDGAGRFSISGVQDKISLKLEGKHLRPTERGGRYILKPMPSTKLLNQDDIVANEHLSMQISQQVFGIPTASNGVIAFSDGELAYVTKRFDYAPDQTKLDQEDFASILQYSESYKGLDYKYASSYEEIAKGIERFVAVSRPALEDFFTRVLFDYAIGNGDAHLKNFSLYRKEERKDMSLTPNYDLLYTKYHIDETMSEMGLDLFEDLETKAMGALGYYSLEDFETFASICKIPPKRTKRIFDHLFASIDQVATLVERSFLSDDGKEAYLENYKERIEKRIAYKIPLPGYEFDSIVFTQQDHR